MAVPRSYFELMTLVNEDWLDERARLRDELRRARRLELLGQLAAGVAHDCNSLLSVIQGHAEMMLNSLQAEDPLRPDITEIATASTRAAALTRQLLTVGGSTSDEPQPVDLNALVRGVEGLLRRMVGGEVELSTELDDESPVVEADQGQLEQVLLNLVLNARDAVGPGGTITIRTEVAVLDLDRDVGYATLAAGRYGRLDVLDTGAGMSAEVLAQAFEPFFTTKPPTRGTGLGLATAQAIVEQFGGAIALASEPGVGTTVSVYLPLPGTLGPART